jgi:hypothetical protein
MTQSFWLNALIVSLTTLGSAWCWVQYTRASTDGKALRAAVADCGIIGLGMVSVVSYVEDHRLAVPVLLAAFIGTFLAVKKR